MSAALQLRRLQVLLGAFAYRYANEIQLQDAIAGVLDGEGIGYQREFVVDPKNRIDFVVDGGVAIEIKVDGSFSRAISQVGRYSALESITAVLLASACAWGRQALPDHADDAFHGKPVDIVALRRKAL